MTQANSTETLCLDRSVPMLYVAFPNDAQPSQATLMAPRLEGETATARNGSHHRDCVVNGGKWTVRPREEVTWVARDDGEGRLEWLVDTRVALAD
jgi:hypothetical protein